MGDKQIVATSSDLRTPQIEMFDSSGGRVAKQVLRFRILAPAETPLRWSGGGSFLSR